VETSSAAAVCRWIVTGWRDYRRCWWISSAYSTIFVLFGGGVIGLLVHAELYPILYPMLTGFMLVAPVAVIGFFRVAEILHTGGQPQFRDFLHGFRQAPPGIWGIALLLGFGFLIWITDALLLYVMYFDVGALPLDRVLVELPVGRVGAFLLFATIIGFVLALAIFAVSAFSLPLLFNRRRTLVPAVVTSVKTVFEHPLLMACWAACLVVMAFFALFVFLPALVVILPVLAFAGYQGYRDLFDVDR